MKFEPLAVKCDFVFVFFIDMFANANDLKDGKMNEVGMLSSEEFAKESVPHFIELLKDVKGNNGKQLTTPIMSNNKYKNKIQAGAKIFMNTLSSTMINESKQDN